MLYEKIEVQMKLLRHWQQLQNLPPSVVTIGNFDGVHAGHQVILQRVLDISRQKNLASVVMYFELEAIQQIEFIKKAHANRALCA